MKDIFMLIRRFIAPYYKGYLSLAVLFNILSALLNLVAFALVMPILNILFQIEERVTTYIPFSSLDLTTQTGWSQMKEVVTNNFGYFVSRLIETEGASYTLIILGIYLVLMTLLKVGATYLGGFFLVPIRTGVVRDLRNQLNAKILALPLGFFSEERKGDVLARITGDVGEVENSVMSSLDLLLKNPILIFVYLGSMLVISWQLTLFVFLVLPIAGFVMGRVGKSLKRTSLEAQNQWGQLISQVEETLGGLRIVKAFTAEEFVDKRFRDSNEEYRQTVIGVNRRQLLAHPVSELLGTATIAIVLWYGGSLILNRDSSIDASTFIYYLVIFYSLINPLKDLSKGAYAIRRGMGSMERVDRILQAESTITDPAQPKPVVFNEAIRLEKVSFRYAEEWVLRDVDLTIRKGQTVALVGHSGSGKSTLVDLIPRFYDVVEGRITIDGTDIREVAVADLRRLMGNVNQEPILFNASVFENIAFGVEGATSRRCVRLPKSRTPMSSSMICLLATKPISVTVGASSPVVSVSASLSPVPSTRIPRSSSLTKLLRPSIPRASALCRVPWITSWRDVRPSSSPTASRRSSMPTSSASSMTGVSSSKVRTTSSSHSADTTPSCMLSKSNPKRTQR